jgi:hypothetical protein
MIVVIVLTYKILPITIVTQVAILRKGINCQNGENRSQDSNPPLPLPGGGVRRGRQNFKRESRSLMALKFLFVGKLRLKSQWLLTPNSVTSTGDLGGSKRRS